MQTDMRKVVKLPLVVLFLAFSLLTSCEKGLFDDDGYRKVVILYMAANNNLSTFAEENISDMKDGFVPSETSRDILLVYKHISGEDPRLVRIFCDGTGVVQEDVVAVYEDQNSADGEVLESVLNKVKAIFPAREYGLILWSHATGWLPEGYYTSPAAGAFYEDPYSGLVKSFGEDRGQEMEVKELKNSIPFKLSYIIFDCCFMGGIETVYELRDKADYIIASPTEILADGFPYKTVMNALIRAETDLEEVCELFYKYYNSKSGVNRSATISLYNTDHLSELASVSGRIFSNNREKISKLDMTMIQPYFRLNKSWFWDMEDLIYNISSPSEFSEFKSAMDKVVVKKFNTPYFLDIEIANYSGMSTYIPNPENKFLDTFYKGFDWNIDTEMID
jgi:hypothetical protein